MGTTLDPEDILRMIIRCTNDVRCGCRKIFMFHDNTSSRWHVSHLRGRVGDGPIFCNDCAGPSAATTLLASSIEEIESW
jgi:hypothetical protein